ncbi:hydrophobic surface binding protein [Mycena leptocephala]|nr:hydrophobic surface binding protein [Mycena leptocephala]
MVQLSSFLVSLLLLTASLGTPLKRTVAQIEADIASITTQVTTLHSAVQAFPATGLAGALGIHTAAMTLETTVKQAAADINVATGPLSEADGSTILNSIVALEPTMLDALQQLIAKHLDFVALPVERFAALIRQDLVVCATSEEALAQALFAVLPADLHTEFTSLSKIDIALSDAISAYS